MSLLEQKYEKIASKLKDTQLLVNKLEGDLITSKEDAEKAIVALKVNYEKEQVNESAKYKGIETFLFSFFFD